MTPTGDLLAAVVTVDEPQAAGWITVPLATPVALAVDDFVRVAYDVLADEPFQWGGGEGGDSTDLLRNQGGVVGATPGGFPDSGASSRYWGDIVFEPADAPVWPVALYGFRDAPLDGAQYVRENGDWQRVARGINYRYVPATTEPPEPGELRFDTANPAADASKVWISSFTPTGQHVAPFLRLYGPGWLLIQPSGPYSIWSTFQITGPGVVKEGPNQITYTEYPVIPLSPSYMSYGEPLDAYVVIDSGASGIRDAPNDGLTYARRNNQWVPLP